jgi:sugar phosphate permease
MFNPFSWPPFIIFFGIYGSLMAFQGVWGMQFLVQHYEMSRVNASSTLLVIALGLIIGCPVAGFFSDSIKRRKLPLFIFTLLYICSWIALSFWPGGKLPSVVLPVLFFAMGFFASGFIIVWACSKEVNTPRMSGSAMGLANMGGFLGAAVMQPLMGWALDHKWNGAIEDGARIYSLDSYRFAFIIATVILILTSASIFFLKETHATNIRNG